MKDSLGNIQCNKTSYDTGPRSCVLAATTVANKGARISDARPAAAADGSKWPMFDFEEALCTSRGRSS